MHWWLYPPRLHDASTHTFADYMLSARLSAVRVAFSRPAAFFARPTVQPTRNVSAAAAAPENMSKKLYVGNL